MLVLNAYIEIYMDNGCMVFGFVNVITSLYE
jgi:hypothetical protein